LLHVFGSCEVTARCFLLSQSFILIGLSQGSVVETFDSYRGSVLLDTPGFKDRNSSVDAKNIIYLAECNYGEYW